jgi:ankyrin repeat protein
VACLRLNLAARIGDFAAIRMLRLCGADLNSTDYDGRTAIMFAAERKDLEILGYLLIEGGNPNQQDRWRGTSLNDALRSKSSVGAHLLQAFGGTLGIIIPAGNIRQSMFSMRRSMFNVQCSTFNVQRSMFNIPQSMFNIQHSTFDVGMIIQVSPPR